SFPCQNRPCGCRSAEQCCGGCCCCAEGAWSGNRARCSAEADIGAEAEPGDCCTADRAAEAGHPKSSPGSGSARNGRGASWRWVTGVSALRCQGYGTTWVSSGAVALPFTPFVWTPHWTVAGVLPGHIETALVLPARPSTPPPRRPLV